MIATPFWFSPQVSCAYINSSTKLCVLTHVNLLQNSPDEFVESIGLATLSKKTVVRCYGLSGDFQPNASVVVVVTAAFDNRKITRSCPRDCRIAKFVYNIYDIYQRV